MRKYSSEELLEKIRIKTKELGRIPKTAEVKSYITIVKEFGTWDNALKQAGYTKEEIYKSRDQYTDDELLNIIRSKTKELGRIPYLKEIKQCRIISKRFGSWNNALILAGYKDIQILKKNKEFTREELLELIRCKCNELGRIPKRAEFELQYEVYKNFDSWNDALKLAGIEIKSEKKKIKSNEKKKKYSDEDLLQKIKNKYNELGEIPKSYQVENYTIIIRRFNGWDNALKKAGFDNKELKKYKKTYTKKDLLNMIKEKTQELGKIPSMSDFSHKHIFVKNFGTWENALVEAGFNKEDILNRNKKYSDEDLLNIINTKYLQLGKIPKAKDVKQYYSIINRFDSWENALKKADLI
ncbi:TPA: homing endonuclease associated repeat-containing protein [Clostridium botulinum]|uniref:homing endonuclease associated repeat-containing protein n=1 Tax=Clostridium botulinum TaxID=1491 RepID=UPI0004663F81|nr:hypothetical protein [Clostridium botulinum]APR02582.1 heme NO binding family protein [Clostridium botulinum]AUN01466.1 hypothetical protein RSJ19_00345 [Clostridium botulinum]MBN3352051.1 hypothetical protein [Clostridium botulinum]MBN3359192.1 hypothetical protein [Clostridium botulinum]MBN3367269.1 hypothetical protein [Clostridium botulinum]